MASPVRTCNLSVMHSRGLGARLAMKAPGDELGAGVGSDGRRHAGSVWPSEGSPHDDHDDHYSGCQAARESGRAPTRSTRIPLRNRAIESPSLPGMPL
jgi:hypothetical protein